MFRLKNKDAKFPPMYEHVARKKSTVSAKGWDRVGDFTLRDNIDLMPQEGLQERLCQCESNLIFVCGQATSGKCAPLDSHVLTPDGFVEMGSLRVGSQVTGFDGLPQSVVAVYDQPGPKEMFTFTLSDGSKAETSAEHLWTVAIRDDDAPYLPCNLTTAEIVGRYRNGADVIFPKNNPVRFTLRNRHDFDAYTFGVVVGSDTPKCCFKYNRIRTGDRAVLDRVRAARLFPYQGSAERRNGEYIVQDAYMADYLKLTGLSGKPLKDRYVPIDFKTASYRERLDFLNGFFAVNGKRMDQPAPVRIRNERLADDILFMLRSVGLMARKMKDPAGWFNVKICPNRQERKLAGVKATGVKPCRCIRVSNPDSLYLMDDFVVTHNTYGMMLKGLNGVGTPLYTGRLINVRKLDSAKGTSMFRDASMVWGDFSSCEVTYGEMPTFAWPRWNNSIQMIHANFNVDNPSEWDAFQEYIKKQQASYICIDEATAIEQFKMFTYIFSRNRDASGVEPQMVLSFNPKYGHWTTDFLVKGGYIDTETWYIRPEMDGRTRYFYIKGDDPSKVVWGDSKDEVAKAAHITVSQSDMEAGLRPSDMVKSFTLITGTAADNRKLVAATRGQSVANLHAVGAEQRAVLAEAYFGPVESEKAGVTDEDIRNLATNPRDEDTTMYATMDVSQGKSDSDNVPMVIWKGKCIVAIEFFRGSTSELLGFIDSTLDKWRVSKRNFAFDGTGLGYYLTGFTEGESVVANTTPRKEFDADGNPVTLEQFFNLRSQLMSKTEVLIKTGEYSTALDLTMRIPYGKNGTTRQLLDVLYDEKNIFRRTTKNNKTYYRSKEEYRARFKSSPDIMDTIVLRAVFELDARPKKKTGPDIEDDAYTGLYNDYSSGRHTIWI